MIWGPGEPVIPGMQDYGVMSGTHKAYAGPARPLRLHLNPIIVSISSFDLPTGLLVTPRKAPSKIEPNVQDPAGFGMQYGVATCHLAFHGNMRDQALLECKDCFFF